MNEKARLGAGFLGFGAICLILLTFLAFLTFLGADISLVLGTEAVGIVEKILDDLLRDRLINDGWLGAVAIDFSTDVVEQIKQIEIFDC